MKYSNNQKLSIINEMEASLHGAKYFSTKYGVSLSTIKNWKKKKSDIVRSINYEYEGRFNRLRDRIAEQLSAKKETGGIITDSFVGEIIDGIPHTQKLEHVFGSPRYICSDQQQIQSNKLEIKIPPNIK